MKKVTPNIGLINGLIRITCGFTMLAWGTSKLVKRPFSNTPLLVIMMGALKVAEGMTRFCPLTYFFEERIEEMTNEHEKNDKQYDNLINPS
ncbi:hypothetical protein BKP37_10355 [Anaerobacillus alkalilacustris]|uniref:Inner membrane protein YgaP-like transmembrane domain-containing protein n=1 Tax=Anaerobacillus alkalilacustris TaxID=393763 RepID=A0A1S2LPS3_9BACI|nr:DUF2892 domain-containing protein [Anaerobacillus alkalilacustris]OIJ13667.1 hypothetical protein BKP37_10355 [Anaerobacillus alkalilacustris]